MTMMDNKALLEAIEEGFDHLRTEIGDRLERLEKTTRKIPAMDKKLDAINEQVNHTNEVLQRYYANVEHPLELRVTQLEGRVTVLENRK